MLPAIVTATAETVSEAAAASKGDAALPLKAKRFRSVLALAQLLLVSTSPGP